MGVRRWQVATFLGFGLMLNVAGQSALAAEEQPVVPDTLPGITVVTAAQVMALVESGKGMIVDARKAEDFKAGTLPGAVNCQVSSGKPDLTDAEVNATIEKFNACEGMVKADKAKPAAIFCNGLTCWRSPKGALAMKKMGFQDVQWYRLGGNDWKEKGFPME